MDTIFMRAIKDPLGLLPDTYEPTGEVTGKIKLTRESLEWLKKQGSAPFMMTRIKLLRQHKKLIPTARALRKLAIEKRASNCNIEGDWELRARVAEAELKAIYFKAQELPARARKQASTKAANALHDKPNGSRSKQHAIRDAWASGKYTSRDRCAEEECGALGMSFAAARKALRNTPAPT